MSKDGKDLRGQAACRCSEVTLDEFVDCLLNGNLRRLLREGEASEEELAGAWEKLYGEYAELSGNKGHQYFFELYRQVYVMRLKIYLAQVILSAPGQVDMADLSTLGYSGDVKGVVACLKRDMLVLKGKEKELEKIQGEKEGSLREADFDDWIIAVGKYLGYGIRRKEMLLSEFLAANRAMGRELRVKSFATAWKRQRRQVK
jgi:hypothetical protein